MKTLASRLTCGSDMQQMMRTMRYESDDRMAERVSARLRELLQEISGVTAAYVRADGLAFTIAGNEWTPELSELGANLAVMLQEELAPNHEVFIDGGYEALGDRVIPHWTRVFP